MQPVLDLFESFAVADPTYSAQLCVRVGGDVVVDVAVGPGLTEDSLLPVYSSSKGATGCVVGLLVDRGALDLDERVATYWPEFAAAGKGEITVRQLLSHQAGLPGVDGGFTWAEVREHDALAEKLAAQRPFWRPGAAFLYHGITIGTLADELCRRIDGRRVGDVLRDDITAPRGNDDLWLGAPEEQDHRVAEALAPTGAELTDFLSTLPPGTNPLGGADPIANLSAPSGTDIFSLFTNVNDVAFRRAGQPAAGMVASARGLAALYASLHHDVGGQPRLLSEDAVGQLSQIQVAGTELGTGFDARFGVLFQKPCTPRWPFGSVQAFGHDGAGGSLAFSDPAHDIAFGYTVQRLPLPGGMDRRAVELAAAVRSTLRST